MTEFEHSQAEERLVMEKLAIPEYLKFCEECNFQFHFPPKFFPSCFPHGLFPELDPGEYNADVYKAERELLYRSFRLFSMVKMGSLYVFRGNIIEFKGMQKDRVDYEKYSKEELLRIVEEKRELEKLVRKYHFFSLQVRDIATLAIVILWMIISISLSTSKPLLSQIMGFSLVPIACASYVLFKMTIENFLEETSEERKQYNKETEEICKEMKDIREKLEEIHMKEITEIVRGRTEIIAKLKNMKSRN